jgi:IclR family acetate operon transcriptional repressor
VIIGKCDGTASIRLAERVGSARPAHATAIGKMLLSAVPAPELDRLLASLPLPPITPKTIVDPETLKAVIREAGENGIAFDDGEFDADVRCLAAPVFDFRNRMIAAIGISAPIWRFGLGRIGEVTELVQSSARDLSRQLGYESKPVAMKSAG